MRSLFFAMLSDTAQGLDYIEPYLYAADASGLLTIIDATNPALPQELGSLPLPDYPTSLCVSGSIACVSLRNATLQLVDVSNPAVPQLLGAASLPYEPTAVQVSGIHAYVTTWGYPHPGEGLYIVDISDPEAPDVVSSVPMNDSPWNLCISGDLAYVVNTADPEAPSSSAEPALLRQNTGDWHSGGTMPSSQRAASTMLSLTFPHHGSRKLQNCWDRETARRFSSRPIRTFSHHGTKSMRSPMRICLSRSRRFHPSRSPRA